MLIEIAHCASEALAYYAVPSRAKGSVHICLYLYIQTNLLLAI